MTKITVYENNTGDIIGFKCKGHAGYADKGEDIVCAAISTLVLNTINSIEQFTDDYFKGEQNEKDGVITFELGDEYSKDTQLLLKSFVLGITSIQKDYKKFISITIEEV